jgi:hypothetical protein
MQHGIAYEPGAGEKVVGRKLAILPANLAPIAWNHAADHVGNDLDLFAGKCPTEDVIALLSVLPTRYAFEKLSPEGHSANAAIAGTVWASNSLHMLSKTETTARRLFAEIYRATVDRPMRYCGLQETTMFSRENMGRAGIGWSTRPRGSTAELLIGTSTAPPASTPSRSVPMSSSAAASELGPH